MHELEANQIFMSDMVGDSQLCPWSSQGLPDPLDSQEANLFQGLVCKDHR